MTELIRRKNTGEAWETVVDTGGGGSQPINSPLDISGCVCWLDAATLSLSDGDPVASWEDGSTAGCDFAQATALNRPIFKTNIQNGLAVVRFQGYSVNPMWLDGSVLDLLRDKPGFTLAYVIGNEDASNNYGTVLFATISGYVAAFIQINDNHVKWTDENVARSDDLGTVWNSGGSPQDAGVFSPAFAPSLAGVDATAGGLTFKQMSNCGLHIGAGNGGFASWPQANLPDDDMALLRIGASDDPDNDSNSAELDLGEWILYDRALKASDRRELAEYLSDKWNTI